MSSPDWRGWSVKTLHLYDRLRLLNPARTDDQSGYRYYTGEQLPRLNAILALKELGFTLDQVRELLDEELSTSQIRGDARTEARGDATHAKKLRVSDYHA